MLRPRLVRGRFISRPPCNPGIVPGAQRPKPPTAGAPLARVRTPPESVVPRLGGGSSPRTPRVADPTGGCGLRNGGPSEHRRYSSRSVGPEMARATVRKSGSGSPTKRCRRPRMAQHGQVVSMLARVSALRAIFEHILNMCSSIAWQLRSPPGSRGCVESNCSVIVGSPMPLCHDRLLRGDRHHKAQAPGSTCLSPCHVGGSTRWPSRGRRCYRSRVLATCERALPLDVGDGL